MSQTAKALGAKTVIGIARNPEKLKRALEYGCDSVISTVDKDNKTIVGEWRTYCKSNGLDNTGWKIFEVTGTKAGQDLALDLLSFVGKLVLVGFGMSKSEYMLKAHGFRRGSNRNMEIFLPRFTRSCSDMILSKNPYRPLVEDTTMSTIAATFDEIHKAGSPAKRVVLKPDFK
jgi:6-hydroxycyclohex-1-ene-1-carbonyl-CoA dehydrogenase